MRAHGENSSPGGDSWCSSHGTFDVAAESESGGCLGCSGHTATRLKDGDRGWGARRRDPRVNGADIYVARFTRNGMGSANPCWRCIEWCRWAGVKRIFHWDADEGRFLVVKVNGAPSGQYETQADTRLFAGMVRGQFLLALLSAYCIAGMAIVLTCCNTEI